MDGAPRRPQGRGGEKLNVRRQRKQTMDKSLPATPRDLLVVEPSNGSFWVVLLHGDHSWLQRTPDDHAGRDHFLHECPL